MKKLLYLLLFVSSVAFAQSPPYKNADSLVAANTISLLQYNRAPVHKVYYSSARLDTITAFVLRNLATPIDSIRRTSGSTNVQAHHLNGNWVTQFIDSVGSGGGSGWPLTGATGTDPSVDYVGTADTAGFKIKRNNTTYFSIQDFTSSIRNEVAIYDSVGDKLIRAYKSTITGINVALGGADASIGLSDGSKTITCNDSIFVNLGLFKLRDGSEGAGKILQSDAGGTASWQTPTFVTSVTASPPLSSSGGTAPDISADTSTANGLATRTYVQSGVFTPTVSDSANVDLSPVNIDANYTKMGAVVTVQYSFSLDATTTLTPTYITVDYPAGLNANPSAFSAGQGVFADGSGVTVIPVDGTHCRANFTPVSTSSLLLQFSVTYQSN